MKLNSLKKSDILQQYLEWNPAEDIDESTPSSQIKRCKKKKVQSQIPIPLLLPKKTLDK